MAASTADRFDIKSAVGVGDFIEYPMTANIIYKGVMVSVHTSGGNAGYALMAADTANTKLVGVSQQQISNSGGSNGDKSIPVQPLSSLRFLELDAASPATATWLEQLVYVLDDHSVALVATTSADIVVGRVVKITRTGTNGRVVVDLLQRA